MKNRLIKKWVSSMLAVLVLAGALPFAPRASADDSANIAPTDRYRLETARGLTKLGNSTDVLLRTSDGGYVLAGSNGIMGLNASLEEVWFYAYSLSDPDFVSISNLTETTGGYGFAGTYYRDSGAEAYYGLIRKSNHTLAWERKEPGGVASKAVALLEATGGGYVVPFTVRTVAGGSIDIGLKRLDASGNLLSEVSINTGASGEYMIYDAVPSADGALVIAGNTTVGMNALERQSYVAKLNPDTGNIVWQQTYRVGGATSEVLLRILPLDGGDYLITGNSGQSLMLLRIAESGASEWSRTYSVPSAYTIGNSLAETRDGGYVVSATSGNTNRGDLWKFDADGRLQWRVSRANQPFKGVYQLGSADRYDYLALDSGGGLERVIASPPSGLTLDDAANTITGWDGSMQYSLNGGAYADVDPLNPPIFAGSASVTVRYKENLSAGFETSEPTEPFVFTPNPVEAVAPIADLEVPYGTELSDIGLPAQANATVLGLGIAPFDVDWDGGTPAYNGAAEGIYEFVGTLQLPSELANPNHLTASVKVKVAAEQQEPEPSPSPSPEPSPEPSPSPSPGPEEPVLTGIETDLASYRLRVGDTHATVVQAVYADGDRSAIAADKIVFSSSRPEIATVNSAGLVTGVQPGTSVISAAYGGFSAQVAVEVWRPSSGGGGSVAPAPTSPSGDRVTASCGSGTCLAQYGDELILELPEGAADGPFTVTIDRVELASGIVPDSMRMLSSAFELLKSFEDRFKRPVVLKLRFDPDQIGEGRRAALFYYDEAGKSWVEVKGKAESEMFVAEVDHFTKFAVFSVAREAVPTPESPGAKPETAFADTAGHWAEGAIRQAALAGVVIGDANGRFHPDRHVTRAEFAAMLMRAVKPGQNGNQAAADFADADRIPAWAQDSVAAAASSGILSGYADGAFRPNQAITRAEIAVLVVRALGLPTDGDTSPGYVDEADIPAWAKGAISVAANEGLVQGISGNRFAPGLKATRAEAAALLVRLLDRLSDTDLPR